MHQLNYLAGYPAHLVEQVRALIREHRLGAYLTGRYPGAHQLNSEQALYQYVMEIKQRHLRTAPPVSRVRYDGKIGQLHQALGTHTFVSRVQGGRLKARNEIRIASLFRDAPLEFLRMIVVHELAHLREKEHGKAFYQLCRHMEPAYHQLELDTRLYLIHLELTGPLYRSRQQPPDQG